MPLSSERLALTSYDPLLLPAVNRGRNGAYQHRYQTDPEALVIRAMEAALERRTIEWQAALAERVAAHAAAEERQSVAAEAAAGQDALYQERVADLTQQLDKSNAQLLQASSDSQSTRHRMLPADVLL